MKKLIFTLVLFCNALPMLPQGVAPRWGDQGNGTYINPVLNADYSDPDAIRVGDKYYMVASDFHFLGLQVLESSDLVNWKIISQVYRRFDYPGWNDNNQYAGGSWAPAVRYHDGRFWVFFCTPKEGLFMSNAVNPAGPWSPLHLVKQVEKWEDPCPFWDDDGQAYLVRSRHRAGPIIIHRMSSDGRKLLDDGVTVYNGPVAEGPKMMKRDGYYYISIPEGGVSRGWQTMLRSKSIYGPYEKKIILEQGSTAVNGPHQGAMVDTPDGKWMFLHFQSAGSRGRVVHLQPMRWENGWPIVGVDYDRNGVGEPVYVYEKPIKSTLSYTPQTDDDFPGGSLGLQWQFNHNPADEFWSLSKNPGSLTLTALKAPSFKSARNTLTQKVMGYVSEATVSMNVSAFAEGQRSGLACMGKENMLLGVRMNKGVKELYLSNDTTETRIAEVSNETCYLRVSIDIPGQKFQFSYSNDNINFMPCGSPFFIHEGNWKGARVALYCYNTEKQAGEASFPWFKYRHDGPQEYKENNAVDSIVKGIALTRFPQRDFFVKSNEKELSSNSLGFARQNLTFREAIQHVIDSCSLAGGGRVVIPAGVYHIDGNLIMRSNVNLHLEKDACLLFSGRADDFLPEVYTRWEGTELYGHSPMIYALHADNIAITGCGTIDAQGGKEFASWAEIEADDRDRLREMGEKLAPLPDRIFGKGTVLRPSCIQFVGCSRILLDGITVKNSPFWTIHPLYCDNVIVRNVTIDSHYPNNDGCDPESTSNVLIEDCTFRTGDDAIAIKAGRDNDGRSVGRPSRNIVIRNCLFNSECNGLCIGSEMSGGVENVYMNNIRIGTVKNALYFKSNRDRGGFIRNVQVGNITVERSKGAILRFETNYFGYRGGSHTSLYEQFHIKNVQAKCSDNYAIFMDGYEQQPMRNIEIENFSVQKAKYPYYFRCTENVSLRDVYVNGKRLSARPEESKERKTLDVY